MNKEKADMIIYTTEDGLTKVETTFDGDTVWLSIDQMAELFQRDRSVIGKHVRNIFKEGELEKEAVWAKFAYTATDGKVYNVDYYNLDTIEIDLDLDELDATSAETKATHQEIKDYVLKEFGLKVSNLYISQIKRKCGIEVGENYNLPKTENSKVPQCPKEKGAGCPGDIRSAPTETECRDDIKAALKYFAMI